MKIELVDSMGSDLSVVNAARVSFSKISHFLYGEYDFQYSLKESDVRLISYLARYGHWSPFAHTSVSLRVRAPLFLARQLAKHQVGGAWNEVSRRYVDEEPEFYMPDVWRGKAADKKQGSSDVEITDIINVPGITPISPSWVHKTIIDMAVSHYNLLLEAGVAPEQARMVLPQSMMTEWIWTGSVYFFARVYNLRADPHAQKEAQEFASLLGDLIEPLFPCSWKALTDGKNDLGTGA